MQKTLELFKKTSDLNWDYHKSEIFKWLEELENFARIWSNLYLRTKILWNSKNKNFFKCEFHVWAEYTECTLFSKGLHVLNIWELKNIENLIIEKLYTEN